MTDLTRRSVLGTLGAGAALATSPAFAKPQPLSAADAATEASLASVAEALLTEYPESATVLGIDTGKRRGLKSALTDRSLGGVRRHQAAAATRLAKLKAIEPTRLSPATATDLSVARYAHEVAVEGAHFPYGDIAILNNNVSFRNTPYVVTQNVGAWYEVPDFLDSNHKVETAADAEAYLARLSRFANALDGETQRLRHDGGLGVIAPDFILDEALTAIRGTRKNPRSLVTSLTRRTAKIPGDWGSRAEAIVRATIVPALDRQIAELAYQRAHASNAAGVWHVPDGEAYYAWALKASTTTAMSPDEVHRLGLHLIETLVAQMDAILRRQGMTRGSVSERIIALNKDPRYLFADSDAGRADLLSYLNGRVADMRQRLPRAFNTLVPGRLIINRVPVEIEAGAPGGYAGAGTMDGSVPGQYYINLRDMSALPKWTLPTLTYHEGIPGHVWQGEYTYKLPLIRTLLSFNAYSEGWALYAEQMGDELGAYSGDELGRLGYLQSIAYRACRLVVDTGLHAKRWTRDQAIRWFVETNGSPESDIRSEIDRYCSWPGQACGYEIGHQRIVQLRARAQARLGSRYNLRSFNDAVVLGGNVPLDVLTQTVDGYIARSKA
ncbi:MAG: DUF885 family protein [Pseudomonadota bacterium]|nr:DUF885 family protein [Pseudomonadota bacterium]